MTLGRTSGTSYVSTPAARAMTRNLAINVRALRQANGWSLKELGLKAKIPWRVIENIEREVNATSFVALIWLADTFDVTVTQLVFYPREALDGIGRDDATGRFAVRQYK